MDLFLSDHVCNLDAGQCRGMEWVEPHHGPDVPLDEAVILFWDVDDVFHLTDPNGFAVCDLQDHIGGLQPCKVCAAFVDDNPLGKGAAGLNAFVKSRFENTWGFVPIDIDTLTDDRMIRDVVEALKNWCYRSKIDLDIGK